MVNSLQLEQVSRLSVKSVEVVGIMNSHGLTGLLHLGVHPELIAVGRIEDKI